VVGEGVEHSGRRGGAIHGDRDRTAARTFHQHRLTASEHHADPTTSAHPASWLGVGFAVALGTLTFAAVGVLLGAVMPTARAAQGIGILLWFTMQMVSGAGPPPEVLSPALNRVGDFLPLSHLVVALQDPWLGGSVNWTEMAVLAAIGLVSAAVAGVALRRRSQIAHRRCRCRWDLRPWLPKDTSPDAENVGMNDRTSAPIGNDNAVDSWAAKRRPYLDNLKVILIASIIVDHGIAGYSRLEFWPYAEMREATLAPVTETALLALVIPFGLLMIPLLFLVAGLLSPPSLERNGIGRYVSDRLLRLGVPFVVFVAISVQTRRSRRGILSRPAGSAPPTTADDTGTSRA
jgi:ABC-2 type transport system permease protein